MSESALPELIVHEVQVSDRIHLSDTARGHIHRLVYQARRQETHVITKRGDYWQTNSLFNAGYKEENERLRKYIAKLEFIIENGRINA